MVFFTHYYDDWNLLNQWTRYKPHKNVINENAVLVIGIMLSCQNVLLLLCESSDSNVSSDNHMGD